MLNTFKIEYDLKNLEEILQKKFIKIEQDLLNS